MPRLKIVGGPRHLAKYVTKNRCDIIFTCHLVINFCVASDVCVLFCVRTGGMHLGINLYVQQLRSAHISAPGILLCVKMGIMNRFIVDCSRYLFWLNQKMLSWQENQKR